MTSKIHVNVKSAPYEIVTGHSILAQLPGRLKKLGLGKDALIVTHPVLKRLYGEKLSSVLKKAGPPPNS